MSQKLSKSANTANAAPDQKKRLMPAVSIIAWAAISFLLANGIVWLLITKIGINLLGIIGANPTVLVFIGSALIYGITLIILLIIPRLVVKKIPLAKQLLANYKELGFDGWLPTWRQLILGVVGFIAAMVLMFVVTLVIAFIISGIDLNQAQDIGFATQKFYSRQELVMIFITLVVLAPIVEEILFRGYLYGKLRANWSAWATVAVVSLLFGLAHGQLNVGIMTATMSVVMCITRELSDSIYPGIIIHMIKNGLAFYLTFVLMVGI